MFKKVKKNESDASEKFDRFSDFANKESIDERFKWHQLIYKLIKELNTTENKVYKMNYISCLNWLAFFKERDEVESNILKKQNK